MTEPTEDLPIELLSVESLDGHLLAPRPPSWNAPAFTEENVRAQREYYRQHEPSLSWWEWVTLALLIASLLSALIGVLT